jgi:DNA-binding HxlR family transcriptional regulator
MRKNVLKDVPVCPVDYAFQRIGGKYKGRIISSLADGILRYGELRRAIPDVTPKMLTQALRELEDDELISRKVYLEVPPRVEYGLTASGKDFLPAIKLIADWGRDQMKARDLTCIKKGPTRYSLN